jgi:hypothetical protein|tara:strand:+ start:54 stop:701 length:648 start_codon:yes stop_codon:yes gene_type:complete
MNYLLISLGWIIGQTMGLGIALLSFKFYHKVFRIEKKSEAPISEFFIATVLLLMGGYTVIVVSIFTLLDDFDKLRLTYVWTFPISILINYYLFLQFPKTKFYKKRLEIKDEPPPMESLINFSFHSALTTAGFIIILAGILNLLFAIFLWFKSGVWELLSLGTWIEWSTYDLNRIDTGWWGIDKMVNYLIFDANAILPLLILGCMFLALAPATTDD